MTTLPESPEFTGAETHRDHCWLACRLLRENHIRVVPYSLIGKILGVDKARIKSRHKRDETMGPRAAHNSRPPLIAVEHREESIQRIEEAYQPGIPWMIREILEFVRERSTEPVDTNNLYH
jgi:hypothetical protein